MMKILVFSPYYPPHIGGLETHSEEFNKYLSEKGADIVVFTPQLPAEAPSTEEKDGVTILRFPAFDIVQNYPLPKLLTLEFWQVFRSLLKDDFDIVISRTRFFPSSFLALVYAKWKHAPFIHIEHGSDFVRLSSPFKTAVAKIYDYTLGMLVFRFADINISISSAVRKFVGRFDHRESPVIYRGLDFESIDVVPENASIREKYPRKVIIATAARLYKWKGIENTIEAIRSLPEDLKSKIVFLIIGDGEDFDRLKKLSKGLPIEMIGKLDRTDVIGILKASDIYIHSSLPGGGLSTSLLEAMYCRCAIIATPNEGADEVIENEKNGIIIFEPYNENIGNAIEKLSADEIGEKRFAEQASSDIRRRFNWENSIMQYSEIFEKISER